MGVTFVIITLLLVILVMPIRVRVKVIKTKVFVYLFFIRILKTDLIPVASTSAVTAKKRPLKFQMRAEYLKLLRYCYFTKCDLRFGGFDSDYARGAVIYGLGSALCEELRKQGTFYRLQCRLYLYGPLRLELDNIFFFQVGKIGYQFLKLRRRIKHGKSTSAEQAAGNIDR